MGRNVLVTGATGFTGRHLCDRLLSEGYSVRALVRDTSRAQGLRDAGVELVEGELEDRDALRRASAGADIVFHVAAMFRPENVTLADMRRVNVEGTRNALEAARENGVARFVHCSTVGVHGDVADGPGDESTPYAPGDHYQVSKMEGELLALEYQRRGRVPVTVCRPGPIYGPRDTRFLKVTRAVAKGRFALVGSGDVVFQLVYVEDLVEGILLCGTVEEAAGGVYILTGDDPVTLRRLFATIAESVGGELPRWHIPYAPVYAAGVACELLFKPFGLHPPLYRRRVRFFKNQRRFDISKAQRELGFSPRTPLREAVHRTVNWYREEGLL